MAIGLLRTDQVTVVVVNIAGNLPIGIGFCQQAAKIIIGVAGLHREYICTRSPSEICGI